jgi:mannonate dehydratase
MIIQDQLPLSQVNDDSLSFFRAIGVDYLTVHAPLDFWEGEDRTDFWKGLRTQAESRGLKLANLATKCWDEIILGLPGRDEKIERWRTILRTLGAAGIPTLGYDFMTRFFRTPATTGRGGAQYSTFVYDEVMREPSRYPNADMPEGRLWENLGYFLERVVPVAEEAGVSMALHPDDPPIPETICGGARIVSSLDQYERIFAMAPSRAHVMLFCQGCVAEMGEDVPSAIRRIGSQGRIAYVHFRNIRGTPKRFQEVFVDEGDVDMYRAMQAYREVGFKGPFMMDHTPSIPGDTGARIGRAFAVGYLRAMIQAVYR